MPHYFALPIPQSNFTASIYRNPARTKKRRRSRSRSPNATTDPEDEDDIVQVQLGPRDLNLKQKHFIILNTIMHRCLLEGDFRHAGRAFGLLIRTKFAKLPRMRSHGLWGIGAEILLQGGIPQEPQQQHPPEQQEDVEAPSPAALSTQTILDPDTGLPRAVFAEPNFAAVMAFFERLIRQHPWSRMTETRDVSALHFYPVLFGLWIYQVEGRSRQARAELGDANGGQSAMGPQRASDPSPDMSLDASDTNSQTGPTTAAETLLIVRRRELAEAREIDARLDLVTAGPPYDRDAAMQRLRGMVALWVGDLVKMVGQLQGKQGREREEYRAHEGGEDEAMGGVSRGGMQEVVDEEVVGLGLKAKEAFRRAGCKVVGVWEGHDSEDGDMTGMG